MPSQPLKSRHNHNSPPYSTRISFDAIGTPWTIDFEYLTQSRYTQLKTTILKRVELFETTFSRFTDDSWVSSIAKKPGTYPLPKDAFELLDLSKKLYILSEGLFTPLIGDTLEQAGYDKTYSLIPKQLSNPLPWDDVIEFDEQKLKLKHHALLDFGAFGKGFLIDEIGKILESFAISSFCIDGSGDILYKAGTDKVLRVGLEHPQNTKQVIGIANIRNKSICASAGNRRSWNRFHHIINPKTLLSPDGILGTWVIAQRAVIADGLATSLFFTNPRILQKEFSFEYLIMYSDHSVKQSENFDATLYYN